MKEERPKQTENSEEASQWEKKKTLSKPMINILREFREKLAQDAGARHSTWKFKNMVEEIRTICRGEVVRKAESKSLGAEHKGQQAGNRKRKGSQRSNGGSELAGVLGRKIWKSKEGKTVQRRNSTSRRRA